MPDPMIDAAAVADVPDAITLAVAPLRHALARASDEMVSTTLAAAKAGAARLAAEADEQSATRAQTIAILALHAAALAHGQAVAAFGAPSPAPAPAPAPVADLPAA